MVGKAKRRIAATLGGDRPRLRTIAVDDLNEFLGGVLDDPRTYQQRYDVGNDDILSINQLFDGIADILGRRRPAKVQIPPALLGTLAPLGERMGKLRGGPMKGLVASVKVDMIGDSMPIRAFLPLPPLTIREAVELALTSQ